MHHKIVSKYYLKNGQNGHKYCTTYYQKAPKIGRRF